MIDAPGFGYAKRSRSEMSSWGKLMRIYFAKTTRLRRVYFLVDVSKPLSELDLDVVARRD